MTSCLVSRSISSMRATSKVAFLAFSQMVFAASFGMMPSSAIASDGMRLDLEPDAETRLGVPDRGHLGAGVARNRSLSGLRRDLHGVALG